METKVLKFTVPGKPVGKQRHCSYCRQRGPVVTCHKAQRPKNIATFTPKPTVQYEKAVKAAFSLAHPNWKPSELPVMLTINAVYPYLKAWSKKKIAQMEEFGSEIAIYLDQHPSDILIPKTTMPDLSNIKKSIEDGLNKVAYVDDNRVFMYCEPTKEYRDVPEPYVDVELTFFDIGG